MSCFHATWDKRFKMGRQTGASGRLTASGKLCDSTFGLNYHRALSGRSEEE